MSRGGVRDLGRDLYCGAPRSPARLPKKRAKWDRAGLCHTSCVWGGVCQPHQREQYAHMLILAAMSPSRPQDRVLVSNGSDTYERS